MSSPRPDFMAPSAKSMATTKLSPVVQSPTIPSGAEVEVLRSPRRTGRSDTRPSPATMPVMADNTDGPSPVVEGAHVKGRSPAASTDPAEPVAPVEIRAEHRMSLDAGDLPIELVSLADRSVMDPQEDTRGRLILTSFIDSLSAKVHPTPPTIDRLSGLFQDFYAIAASHINTHISALASKQSRSSSPTPSQSSLSSTASRFRAKAVAMSGKEKTKMATDQQESEQQMMTTEEIAERKRARKVLEQKRCAMEESIERKVCEGVYERIWRHRSTQDEAQDDKLRSKTAALSVVGIGLTDLGVNLVADLTDETQNASAKEAAMRLQLEGAREEIVAMNAQKYPLGKLHHLKAAHRNIVDTLAQFHPSSSADEIMPTLIYTLITMPTENLDVISNLYFIQRFRWELKVDGEAAYCLTNLEAAITFLETVDLSSLRSDEAPSGPPKSSSRPGTPTRPDTRGPTVSSLSAPTLCSANTDPPAFKTPPAPASMAAVKATAQATHSRRLSNLFQPPAQAIGAASDAILDTADQGFKTIGNSLGDSYRFLLGKLKERQEDTSGRRPSDVIVPKTLEDARKLVSTPPPEDDGSSSEASYFQRPLLGRQRSHSGASSKASEDKMLHMITGLGVARDRSGERNPNTTRKISAANPEVGKADAKAEAVNDAPTTISSNTAAVVAESMRNLGNTLNPISKFAGIGMMRGFSRTPAASPVPPQASSPMPDRGIVDGGVADLTTTFPELATVLPPKQHAKVAPPKQRYMELQNPGDLKINEVLDLLRDYRRLASALRDRDAFS